MEKAQHFKIEIEMLFIDFQQAFDSINRNELKRAGCRCKIEEKQNEGGAGRDGHGGSKYRIKNQ